MASSRLLAQLLPIGLLVAVACGAGQSQEPPTTSQQLACLGSLQSDCCPPSSGEICMDDWASAQDCGNWPPGARVLVYSTPCGGFTVVSVQRVAQTFSKLYFYDATSATLVAIGDDAQTGQPGQLTLECGAGPGTLTIPETCGTTWLTPSQGGACGSQVSAPKSVCQ